MVLFNYKQLVSIFTVTVTIVVLVSTGRMVQAAGPGTVLMDELSESIASGHKDPEMLQIVGSGVAEEQTFRCENRADEGCVALLVESLLYLEEKISSSICKPVESLEWATSLDVVRLRKQLTQLDDGVYLLERKRQELMEIVVSPHLPQPQTLRVLVLVAMTTKLHSDVIAELTNTSLEQQDLFQQGLQVRDNLEALLREIRTTTLELNDSLSSSTVSSQDFNNHKILLRQISHNVSATINSTEGVYDNAQSTSLETSNVFDRVDKYLGEFFHALLHLLDQITKGISSVMVSADQVTIMLESFNVLSADVKCLDSEVADMFEVAIDTLRSATNKAAYTNNLVKESFERKMVLDSLLSEIAQYKEEVIHFENTLPSIIQHALDLHQQVQTISYLLEDCDTIPSSTDVLETLNSFTNITDEVSKLLHNTSSLATIPLILLSVNDVLHDSYLLVDVINMLHSQATSAKLHPRVSQMTLLVRYLNSILANVSEGTFGYSELEEGIGRATRDQASVSKDIGETAPIAMRANERANKSLLRVENIECSVPCGLAVNDSESNQLQTVVQEVSSNVRTSSQLITSDLSMPIVDLVNENHIIGELVKLTNENLDSVEREMTTTASVFNSTENILLGTYNYFNEVSLPVQFDGDTVITLSSQSSRLDDSCKISLTIRSNEVRDYVILHFISFFEIPDYVMSVSVGIHNETPVASFVFIQPLSETVSVNLTVTETKIDDGERYVIEATRSDRVVYLFLHNLETEVSYNASKVLSETSYSSFRNLHIERTTMFVGGAPSSDLQDTFFTDSLNYSGCISDVTVNGFRMNLWTAGLFSTNSNDRLLHSCDSLSSSVFRPQLIKCTGAEFATSEIKEGSLLPLTIHLSTFQHNTLLLYADNMDEASSLQMSLVFGHIIVRITSNNRQRTLTSQETYSKGSKRSISLRLSRSQRSLVLASALEETTRGLRQIETSAVLNYTRLYVGGSPAALVEDGGLSLDVNNLTGCIAVSSSAVFQPTPPVCVMNDDEFIDCDFCSNKGVSSASFYGASYSSFPQITIGGHFHISFKFLTSYSSGLFFHAGNASDRNWFTLQLVDSRMQVLFGSQILSGLSLRPNSGLPLNDSKWHSVSFLSIESSVVIYIDGSEAGNYPFGGQFPFGALNSDVIIGGFSPSSRQLVLPGLPTTGFKGHISDVHVLGKVYDFSTSTNSNFVNFNICEFDEPCDNSSDVCEFSESFSFAEYDLGRFEPNFSLGFQLRTVQSIGILFYVYSRRRADAFAVQITDGKLGLYAASDEPSDSAEVLLSSETIISDGEWHSVVIEKLEGHIILMVDEVTVAETMNAPLLMRTNSALYIGGLPGNRRIPLPDAISALTGFVGQLRMNFLPHSTLSGDVQCGS